METFATTSFNIATEFTRGTGYVAIPTMFCMPVMFRAFFFHETKYLNVLTQDLCRVEE
jgi:hypothetical protein